MAAIVGITLVLHYVWLARFREGYVTEWDESRYIQFGSATSTGSTITGSSPS